jgi:hypothetical protein
MQKIEGGDVHISEIRKEFDTFKAVHELQMDSHEIFDIAWHWTVRHICCFIAPNFHHWLVTRDTSSWWNYLHFAKCNFSDWIMKEELDDVGEFAIPNFRDNIPKLTARYQCQQIVPIFQWKFAEIMELCFVLI